MERIRFHVVDGIFPSGQEAYEVVDVLDGLYTSYGIYGRLDEAECAALRLANEREQVAIETYLSAMEMEK